MTMTVITLRGTGNQRHPLGIPLGMVAEVTKHLPAEKFDCFEPAWPAQIAPGTGGASLNRSVQLGVTETLRLIRGTPNRVGLVSYSLGGLVASEVMAQINEGKVRNADGSQLEVAFVCNISNPARAAGDSVGGLCGPTHFGLNGQHRPWPTFVNPGARKPDKPLYLEYANPADIITNAHPMSPMRAVNDLIEPLSTMEGLRLGNPGQQVNAVAYMTWLMAEKAYRDPRMLGAPLAEAVSGLRGYLTPFPAGEHVCYAVRKMPGQSLTYTEHAAQTILRNFA